MIRPLTVMGTLLQSAMSEERKLATLFNVPKFSLYFPAFRV